MSSTDAPKRKTVRRKRKVADEEPATAKLVDEEPATTKLIDEEEASAAVEQPTAKKPCTRVWTYTQNATTIVVRAHTHEAAQTLTAAALRYYDAAAAATTTPPLREMDDCEGVRIYLAATERA